MSHRDLSARDFHRYLSSHSDECVTVRAVAGCHVAFSELMRRYKPRMQARARSALPGTLEVDDAVQDAIITAWHKLPELREPAKVRSWLERIAIRKAVDRMRTTVPSTSFDDGIGGTGYGWAAPSLAGDRYSPEKQVELSAALEALRRVLAVLPDLQRECWVLREIGGYSYEELADEFQLPHSTVRGVLARARSNVAEQMKPWRE